MQERIMFEYRLIYFTALFSCYMAIILSGFVVYSIGMCIWNSVKNLGDRNEG